MAEPSSPTPLRRPSLFYFAAILLLVLWAFWPSYFSRPFAQKDLYIHAHAMSMTLWCALVVLQVFVVGCKQLWLHEWLGKLSPLLVLLIVASTLAMIHHRMQSLEMVDWQLTATAFNVTTLVVFVLLYGLAMVNRRDRKVHAGFMLCTTFPLFTAFVPSAIQGSRTLEHVSFTIFGTMATFGQAALLPADLLAVVLSILDWRRNRRLLVFPVALLGLGAIHLATMTLYRVPMWKWTLEWFQDLPSL